MQGLLVESDDVCSLLRQWTSLSKDTNTSSTPDDSGETFHHLEPPLLDEVQNEVNEHLFDDEEVLNDVDEMNGNVEEDEEEREPDVDADGQEGEQGNDANNENEQDNEEDDEEEQQEVMQPERHVNGL
ncbi:acidic leucine-rich nuclear phosphoprotein 32 family member B [Spodoptera frugiperda]|uniref:Acidic leucine-rich nuclear phosphoprotein 32 family member B n=1 Tax=Spodoptera frugiperda TaxID=7108 RepID=A0A9R0CZZ3_SPOFR|nr:acidic leucine-rich nuclear phosphoprotein 32 family member B [Spodoptera frugiperda]